MRALPRRDPIRRQLRLLARLHTRTPHSEWAYGIWGDIEECIDEDHPAHTYDVLLAHFNARHAEPLGRRAAALILCRATRGLRLMRVAGGVALVASLGSPVLFGWPQGLLPATVIAVGRKILLSHRRRVGARVAQALMDGDVTLILHAAQLTRVLRGCLDDVDASTVRDVTWGPVLMACVSGDETERETMTLLADQYHGTVAELLDTSRALAR